MPQFKTKYFNIDNFNTIKQILNFNVLYFKFLIHILLLTLSGPYFIMGWRMGLGEAAPIEEILISLDNLIFISNIIPISISLKHRKIDSIKFPKGPHIKPQW